MPTLAFAHPERAPRAETGVPGAAGPGGPPAAPPEVASIVPEVASIVAMCTNTIEHLVAMRLLPL